MKDMPDKIGLDKIIYWLNDNHFWPSNDDACTNKELVLHEPDPRPQRHLANEVFNSSMRTLANGLCTKISIDQNTLKWKSWSSHGRIPTPSLIPSEGDATPDQPLQALTAGEFRQLRDQVREARVQSSTRRQGIASKSSRRPDHGDHGDPVCQAYRHQLGASLRAFRARHWTPYEGDNPGPDPVMPQRSRPPSGPSNDNRIVRSRPTSSRYTRPTRRPHSSPPIKLVETSTDVHRPPSPKRRDSTHSTVIYEAPITPLRDARFDTLTPDVVFELSDGVQPESVYGDRPESVLSRLEELELYPESLPSRPSTATFGFSRGVTPLIEDSGPIRQRDRSQDRNSIAYSDKDTDLESDEEDYPEPNVETMNLDDLPTLSLRPEKVDALDIPIYARGDRRKYDFDASVIENPAYEFVDALSQPFDSLDLKELSKSDKNWRELTEVRSEDPVEELIFDRMIQLEKLQQKTIEVEKVRQERQRNIRLRQNKSRVYPASRVQSAKTWREKKCCMECVQSACVGDCPTKPSLNSTTCLLCSEKDCNGNCSVSVYESRTRSESVEEKSQPKLPQRPKSCTSCQTRHNAKLINANNLILGRPKSGLATFAKGQNSTIPKDLRLSLADMPASDDLEKRFCDLGIDTSAPEKTDGPSRPGTASSGRKRHIGRAGVLPGKSYFSQRRDSLTKHDSTYQKARIEANKNIRSARQRRPKTAA